MNTLISISTYKKNEALDELMWTLIKHNYNNILIADDNDGEAKSIYYKYRDFKSIPKLIYCTGPNLGISGNKNRGIKYFLSHSQYDSLLMLDDDLLFTRSGLLEHIDLAIKDAKIEFITGYWTDKNAKQESNIKQVTGNSWYEDFPVKAATDYISWHEGSQGAVMFVTRKAINKVGYFNMFPEKYGYEHSLYFSRLLRAHESCPRLFPVLRFCERWYHGNDIPNNYEVNRETLVLGGSQSTYHDQMLGKVFAGYEIYNKDHGLSKKKELVLD